LSKGAPATAVYTVPAPP